MLDELIDSDSKKPTVGQYWEISNGKDSIYTYIVEKDALIFQVFEQNVRGDT